jgi:hypothetical protein
MQENLRDRGLSVLSLREQIMKIMPSEVLNAADVEGLFRLGAPSDEYTSEAQMISEAIAQLGESELTQEGLEAVVRNVWVRMFGPFSEEQVNKRGNALSHVAREILKLPHGTWKRIQ